jgi:hypothetical protein
MAAGRRAKKKATESSHEIFTVGDEILVKGDDGSTTFRGSIIGLGDDVESYLVEFKDKTFGTMEVHADQMVFLPEATHEADDQRQGVMPGDDEEDDDSPVYDVQWSADKSNFHFRITGQNSVEGYGWWRKTRGRHVDDLAYAVDIYVKHDDKDYSLESIAYHGKDPRLNIKALDADIVAAAQRWMTLKLNGGAMTIGELRKRADQPTIEIRRLETLDRIIMKLKEYRITSIRSGGTRTIELMGDKGEQKLFVNLDVTPQAIMLDGRIPSLSHGATYDNITGKRGETARGRTIVNVPEAKNVEALQASLLDAKAKGDIPTQRKIRALLRQMGHRGGARALAAKQQAAQPQEQEHDNAEANNAAPGEGHQDDPEQDVQEQHPVREQRPAGSRRQRVPQQDVRRPDAEGDQGHHRGGRRVKRK